MLVVAAALLGIGAWGAATLPTEFRVEWLVDMESPSEPHIFP